MRLVMHVDGGCWPNPGQSFCGVVVRDERGVLVENIHRNLGMGTNNTAEWGALITALEFARARQATHATVYMDSNLVVQQINGNWKVKDKRLRGLYEQAWALRRELASGGCSVRVEWVPREQNAEADALSR